MSKLILKNVMLRGELTDIRTENGKITAIGKCAEDGVDMGGLKIYPGLIDIHSHGCMGHDAADGDGTLGIMADYQLSHGTTTWYPTTGTMPKDETYRVLSIPLDIGHGANLPGYHMEGPFLHPKKRGAHREDYLNAPKLQWILDLPLIKRVTLAPELPGAKEIIEKAGVQVTIGHTDADYDTAVGAMKAGANCLTHTFNAMNGIHHRNPGPIPAAMDCPWVYTELISDGFHVHPAVVRLLVRGMGYDRVILVSDAIRSAGLPDGEYESNGLDITVRNRQAYTSDGTIAGSNTLLFGCVKSAISFGIPEEEAVKMATENPARLMGLNKGKVEVGYDAEFILVDGDFNLKNVVVRGELYPARED